VNASAPRVSICIPTYKGEQTLGAAIESVLAQTLTDFELVVIDDQSPDGTRELVAGFADVRIRYLRNETNLGPEGNWNRCLVEAKGKYFKLLPHDDVLRKDCLTRQVGVLEADLKEQVALVFCSRTVLGPDSRVLTQRRCPGQQEGRLSAQKLMRTCVRSGTNVIGEPGAVMMRRVLAQRIGRFDASQPYVIDLDYWFRLLAHGDAHYCSEPLASFRVSSSQWSVAIGQAQDKDFMSFVHRFSGHFDPPLDQFDMLRTRWNARRNMWMRMLFYKLYLRGA